MKQEKRRILFFAKGGFNVAVYERVLRRLLADPRIEMTFSARDTLGRSENAVFEPFGFERARRVHYRLARLFRYDLYLSPDIYCLGRRARVKAHTFHGISIKGQSFSKKALVYDRLFLIGSYQRRRFAELGVTSEDDPRFVNIGMPKTDAFFDDSLSRNSFLKDLGLDPDRKTVLYAPTWRPESSLHSIGLDLIRALSGSEYNTLVKLHELAYAPTEKVDWRAALGSIAGPRLAVLERPDVTPALFAADLLISDASSVANEYTLLDRPIVFIEVPSLFEKYADTIDLSGWGQSSGLVASDAPGVLRAIESSFADPAALGERRRQIAAEGFYNPGRATEAAIGEIYRLIELNPPGDASP